MQLDVLHYPPSSLAACLLTTQGSEFGARITDEVWCALLCNQVLRRAAGAKGAPHSRGIAL